MVMILGLKGDDSIRMSQIPKLGDGINCVFLIDKRDKLAPMSPQNTNQTTGYPPPNNLIRVSSYKTNGCNLNLQKPVVNQK